MPQTGQNPTKDIDTSTTHSTQMVEQMESDASLEKRHKERKKEHINRWVITEILLQCHHAFLACVHRYHLPSGTLPDIPNRCGFGI